MWPPTTNPCGSCSASVDGWRPRCLDRFVRGGHGVGWWLTRPWVLIVWECSHNENESNCLVGARQHIVTLVLWWNQVSMSGWKICRFYMAMTVSPWHTLVRRSVLLNFRGESLY
jgi:hypothetical protein